LIRASLILGGSTYIIYVIANIISISNQGNRTLQYGLMIPAAGLEGVC